MEIVMKRKTRNILTAVICIFCLTGCIRLEEENPFSSTSKLPFFGLFKQIRKTVCSFLHQTIEQNDGAARLRQTDDQILHLLARKPLLLARQGVFHFVCSIQFDGARP